MPLKHVSPQYHRKMGKLQERQEAERRELQNRHVTERRDLYNSFRLPGETLAEAIARLPKSL